MSSYTNPPAIGDIGGPPGPGKEKRRAWEIIGKQPIDAYQIMECPGECEGKGDEIIPLSFSKVFCSRCECAYEFKMMWVGKSISGKVW